MTESIIDNPTYMEHVRHVARYQIPEKIRNVMGEFEWHKFTTGIEVSGHDNGHGSSGPTMSVKDAAAYDPLFWFFHSNWDRLWWEWQQIIQATTQWTFRSTITPLAWQAFFQSTQPTACAGYREKSLIDLDFQVEADAVIGRYLTADIELLTPGADRIGRRFPLRACGDPTLNVRLLLQEAP